jgi:hypothetical protein
MLIEHRLDASRLNHFGRSVHLWTMVTVTGSAMETSAGLIRLAAEGDEVAFARIVDAHHADITRVCFVVTGGDAELTAEAIQSAWPIAWRKLDTPHDNHAPLGHQPIADPVSTPCTLPMLGASITHHDEDQTNDGQRIQRCARDAGGRGGPARCAGFGCASRGCRGKGASATREPAATRRRRALDRRSQRGRPHG